MPVRPDRICGYEGGKQSDGIGMKSGDTGVLLYESAARIGQNLGAKTMRCCVTRPASQFIP